MAYSMKGSPMQRNYGIGSPAKHKKYSKAKGDKNDHGPELKHNDSPEAHNIKVKYFAKKGKPGKAAYGNKDQGSGVQTYKEYTDEINAKKKK